MDGYICFTSFSKKNGTQSFQVVRLVARRFLAVNSPLVRMEFYLSSGDSGLVQVSSLEIRSMGLSAKSHREESSIPSKSLLERRESRTKGPSQSTLTPGRLARQGVAPS